MPDLAHPSLLESLWHFVLGSGTSIAAYLALVASVGRWLWQTYFVRASVDVIPNGPIEIGFTNHGNVVAMRGVLAGHHKDVIISRMEVTVTREDGGIRVLVPHVARVGTDEKIVFAQAIALKKDDVQPYNVVCRNDAEAQYITDLQARMLKAFNDKLAASMTPAEIAAPNANEIRIAKARGFWDQFRQNNQEVTREFDQLLQRIYWTAGKYTFKMRIFIYKQKTPITIYENGFTLVEDDVQKLRANMLRVLQYGAGIPGDVVGSYLWANNAYRDTTG
jgi:hypothetical protein